MSGELYRVLGLKADASEADIQKAYRRLVKSCHPDLHPGDKGAEERFKKISGAYDILRDKDKRALYDRGLIDDQGNEVQPQFGGWGGGTRPRGGASAGGFTFRTGSGGFAGLDEVLSDLFGNNPGRGQARGTGAHEEGFYGSSIRGSDVRYALDIDFLEAARGTTRRVVLPDGRTLDVKVPAGAEDGQTLRLRGQGTPGPGGLGGDALIDLKVRPHARFRREGLDVHVDQPVPLAVAVAGGKVSVPTLDGDVSLKVPAWSSSGKVLRLKGRGVVKAGQRGDQFVRLMVDLPSSPDPDLASALEAWAKARA